MLVHLSYGFSQQEQAVTVVTITVVWLPLKNDKYKNEIKRMQGWHWSTKYAYIQGGSDNTAPLPHNHPYISSRKLQLAEISTAATYCNWGN